MITRFVIAVGVATLLVGSASAQDYCDQVKQAVATYGYASAADSSQCPFIIKPSSHERVVIDAHRGDWM